MNTEYSLRGTIIAFVLVIIAIAAGGVLLLSSQPDPVEIVINPPVPTATALPTITPAPILVYITGAIANPQQTVTLAVGSRVQDVIDAAGGLLDNADLERVNLAGVVRDGDQIHVFAIDEIESSLATPGSSNVVYINTATQADLETLPGVGPALALRIIEYREANGPFADFAALDEVNGVGPAMLENLQGLVSFD